MSGEKKWKVYCYTNTINGKKYVGITCTSLAARSGKNGNKYVECPYFGYAIKKYGWDSFSVEILCENLSASEAALREDYYIELLKTRNPDFGYNIRPGGFDKHEFSEDGRKKFIESHTGENSARARKTSVYDLTGKLIQTFPTATEAASFLGVTDVTASCKYRKGTIGNCIVRYESDFPGITQLPDDEIYGRYDFRLLYKPVNQYDLNGHFIRTYPSIKEATKAVSSSKCGKSSICACLKGNQRTAFGYMWRYFCDGDCSDIAPLPVYIPKSGKDLPLL